jgi:hypothetical protein
MSNHLPYPTQPIICQHLRIPLFDHLHMVQKHYSLHIACHIHRICYFDDRTARIVFVQELNDAPVAHKSRGVHNDHYLWLMKDDPDDSQFFRKALADLLILILNCGF